jgi:hypothetical protein
VSDLEFHPLADSPARLEEIGRGITARIDKLEKLTAKGVDHVDSIEQLLAEAEKLCGTPECFEQFKCQHCPKLGKSRAYELLAIKDGRKSLEDNRAATRARVAKHRAAKRTVTERESVTSDAQTKGVLSTPINEPETPETSAEERKAQYAAADDSSKTKAAAPARAGTWSLAWIDAAAGPEHSFWQKSIAEYASTAIGMRSLWDDLFPGWRQFKAASDVITLANEAAAAWTELSAELSAKAGRDRADDKAAA